jgi:hypothetical protein
MEPKTYLTGPISLKNNGVCREWREMVTVKFKEFGIESLNPFNIEGNTDEVRQEIFDANQRGDIGTTRTIVSSYMINTDLKMVGIADFLTVWIPKFSSEICGSYGEATLAYYLKKPIYVITERSLKPNELPSWLTGLSTEVFSNWEDYFIFIEKTWAKNGQRPHQ